MLFAIIEGWSTHLQREDNILNWKIDALRFELENAHSVLYCIVMSMYPVEVGGLTDETRRYTFRNPDERDMIHEIFSKYSFMFSQDLKDFYTNEISRYLYVILKFRIMIYLKNNGILS